MDPGSENQAPQVPVENLPPELAASPVDFGMLTVVNGPGRMGPDRFPEDLEDAASCEEASTTASATAMEVLRTPVKDRQRDGKGDDDIEDPFVEKTPFHLLLEKTPEGHRRIRGQQKVATASAAATISAAAAAAASKDSMVTLMEADSNNNNCEVEKDSCNALLFTTALEGRAARTATDGGVWLQSEEVKCISPVELQVTNLDQSIEQREMKRLISSMFREHVAVLHVSVFFQSDGNMAACVRVPTVQDAQLAISQLHRKKVGYKRILISYSHCNSQNSAVLRSKVASLLSEVPDGKIQLFKFREMYEKRFHDSIGVSDLYKMRDLVAITEEQSGRMVQLIGQGCWKESAAAGTARSTLDSLADGSELLPRATQASPHLYSSLTPLAIHGGQMGSSLLLPDTSIAAEGIENERPDVLNGQSGVVPKSTTSILSSPGSPGLDRGSMVSGGHQSKGHHSDGRSGAGDVVLLDAGFCPIHCPPDQDLMGWAERENGMPLPNVIVSLSQLGPNLKQLIQDHKGSLPLASLYNCYTATFGEASLPIDSKNGVPLEHLASCIRGIQIAQSTSGLKRVSFPSPTLTGSSANSGLSGFAQSASCWVVPAKTSRSTTPFNLDSNPSGLFINGKGMAASASLLSSASSSASSSLTNLASLSESLQIGGGGFSNPALLGPAENLSGGGQAVVGSSGSSASGLATAAPLVGQLSLFSRELVDLVKTSPGCRMPFHKFIPSYHHHFGRQCRVADYGFTKLKELFEAMPNVVQILGEGSRAIITLSHRAQVKRFTSDLLRVLKSQASKQLCLTELPAAFERTLGRQFKISEYGVCDLEDILLEVSETSVVLSGEGDELKVAIPKREQTQDEMERTHQFASECIELLRHAPDCQLAFNKFVPAYHHHFGRQCRVADYGFTKLIELFEAIPFTVEISEDAEGERLLILTDSERLAVLGSQVVFLIGQAHGQSNNGPKGPNHHQVSSVPLDKLEDMYRRQFGYPLRPDNYGESSVAGVMGKLSQVVRLDGSGSTCLVRLIDKSFIRTLMVQVKEILSEQVEGAMVLKDFIQVYEKRFLRQLDLDQVKADLADLVVIFEEATCKVSTMKALIVSDSNNNEACDLMAPEGQYEGPLSHGENGEDTAKDATKEGEDTEKVKVNSSTTMMISLTPLQLCALKIQKLLEERKDKILYSDFEAAFVDKYKTPLCPGQYGHPSLSSLIRALPEQFSIRGRCARKMVVFNRDGESIGGDFIGPEGTKDAFDTDFDLCRGFAARHLGSGPPSTASTSSFSSRTSGHGSYGLSRSSGPHNGGSGLSGKHLGAIGTRREGRVGVQNPSNHYYQQHQGPQNYFGGRNHLPVRHQERPWQLMSHRGGQYMGSNPARPIGRGPAGHQANRRNFSTGFDEDVGLFDPSGPGSAWSGGGRASPTLGFHNGIQGTRKQFQFPPPPLRAPHAAGQLPYQGQAQGQGHHLPSLLAQQDIDLAQFGIYPSGPTGQFVAGSSGSSSSHRMLRTGNNSSRSWGQHSSTLPGGTGRVPLPPPLPAPGLSSLLPIPQSPAPFMQTGLGFGNSFQNHLQKPERGYQNNKSSYPNLPFSQNGDIPGFWGGKTNFEGCPTRSGVEDSVSLDRAGMTSSSLSPGFSKLSLDQ